MALARQIVSNIYWVGVKDWNLREFHGYKTPNGSTYNSYLIMDEQSALIDGVKAYLSDEMIERVASITDLSRIKYLIVNHVEMDHSGNIPELMKRMPQAVIVTNAAGQNALKAHFDTNGWQFQIVKTGDKLSLGRTTLEFMTTPLLHWPDSMMTYDATDQILFSNDGFGQHYCSSAFTTDEVPIELVYREAKSYYANILFPYGKQAAQALKNAQELNMDIRMIAPSHGIIWQGEKAVQTILAAYTKWASAQTDGSAVVVYDSMWGATARLADVVTRTFEEAGVPVVKRCLGVTDISEVICDVLEAKYVAIGTPTLNNEVFPRVSAFMTYLKGLAPKNKIGFAFGSYGWKPGVVNQLQTVFETLGWQTVLPFEERYTPQSDVLDKLRTSVRMLCQNTQA